MSGICGIVRFDGQAVKKEEIQKMLDAMKNRGKDAEGIWIDGNVGFGHKMLWTTPESLHENQPLISKDGNLVLTADARIDNRNELFEQLKINENDFKVITDIDLILWSYEKWGEQCVEFIRGDFVFAIWDTIKKKLFCVRDRIGLKPFNYFLNHDYLIFSSEISSIFIVSKIKKQENLNTIKIYISHLAIPHSETFYKNIKRLPPSSYLSLTLDDSNFKIHRYWFPEKIKINKLISLEDAAKKFLFLFKQAIKSNMRSAYPIAFEVSGGLDSSSVLCVGDTIESKQQIIPYTLYYKDLPCNEIEYIETLEDEKNINILKIDVNQFDCKEKYKLNYLFSYSNVWPAGGAWIEHLAKNSILSKRKVRVVLTGLGGDEVISTSLHYINDYKKERKYWKIFKEVKCMKYPFLFKFKLLISLFLPFQLKKILKILMGKRKLLQNDEYPVLKEIIEKEELTNYAYENVMSVLSAEISYWADMNPTQVSGKDNIEYRHPFYDTHLIEFLFSLPPEYRNECGIYKSILRVSMKNILPYKILNRKDKAHFWSSMLYQMKQWDIRDFLNNSTLVKKSFLEQKDIEILFENQNESTSVIYFWIYLNFNGWYNDNFEE